MHGVPPARIAALFWTARRQNSTAKLGQDLRMYYEPGSTPHGLPYNPFKSCIVPRPIGWISTTSAAGIDNLAPVQPVPDGELRPADADVQRQPDGRRGAQGHRA